MAFQVPSILLISILLSFVRSKNEGFGTLLDVLILSPPALFASFRELLLGGLGCSGRNGGSVFSRQFMGVGHRWQGHAHFAAGKFYAVLFKGGVHAVEN